MAQTEFFSHNLETYMSKGYQPDAVTLETGDDDFLHNVMEGNAPPLPELLTRESSGMTGSGNEFETGTNIVSDYYDFVRFPLGEFLNSEMGGALWHQAAGGGITDTPVVGSLGAHDHTFGFALDSDAAGFDMLTRSFIFKVGGISYIYSAAVDELTISWDGGEFPKYQTSMLGNGYHKPLSDFPSLVLPTLESQIPFRYQQSVGASLEWTGAPWGGLYNAAASGRFMAFSFTIKNNTRTGPKERQPNDPILVDADGIEGAVQRRLRRGKREGTLRITLRLDNLTREFKAQKSKAICTGFKLRFQGDKIGATTARYEWEMKTPKFRIVKVTPDEMDGEEVLHLDLKPYKDTVSNGLFTGRVRNNNATGILALA